MVGNALHLCTYGPEHGLRPRVDAGQMIFLECTAEVADLIRPFLGR
ncbi:MAG: hypothetical protein ACRDRH_18825 [Pseudonocardia sp.]